MICRPSRPIYVTPSSSSYVLNRVEYGVLCADFDMSLFCTSELFVVWTVVMSVVSVTDGFVLRLLSLSSTSVVLRVRSVAICCRIEYGVLCTDLDMRAFCISELFVVRTVVMSVANVTDLFVVYSSVLLSTSVVLRVRPVAIRFNVEYGILCDDLTFSTSELCVVWTVGMSVANVTDVFVVYSSVLLSTSVVLRVRPVAICFGIGDLNKILLFSSGVNDSRFLRVLIDTVVELYC